MVDHYSKLGPFWRMINHPFLWYTIFQTTLNHWTTDQACSRPRILFMIRCPCRVWHWGHSPEIGPLKGQVRMRKIWLVLELTLELCLHRNWEEAWIDSAEVCIAHIDTCHSHPMFQFFWMRPYQPNIGPAMSRGLKDNSFLKRLVILRPIKLIYIYINLYIYYYYIYIYT